ncbi:hypothetical protein N7456_008668 [Penicillium angulare]|uniref:Uncharacterized protein n=1 Tax=Penicillium angulare TaxID=116970 RepID=A0A9W9K5E1_9EURO|nr:hypothetical protein N7456_008668 [Penicillium angulare]
MFATQSPSTPFRQTSHYTPVRPSPLGQRSTNIATAPWAMGSPTRAGPGSIQTQPKPTGTEENSNSNFNAFSPVAFSLNNQTPTHNDNDNDNFNYNNERPQHQRQHHSSPIFATTAAPNTPFFFSPHPNQISKSPSPSPSTRNSKFADRYASQVSNPMKTSNGLTRSKTRKMFLNKVRSERDEGRFEARGEQMMHADYLADKRRWEESMARDMVVQEPEDVDADELVPDETELRALDDFVLQEEAMERAMQEDMELNGSFSDDEYDDIFNTLPDSAIGYQNQNQNHDQNQCPSQDMDMS